MKDTKVSSGIGIISNICWLSAIIVLVAACDVLESDPDVLEPHVDVTGTEVYVLANGATFIDLQSKVQTNQPARLAVTGQPKSGSLNDLGEGILQYLPSTGSGRGRDGFEFTVYSESNEILRKDSLIIIIENDSTNLPCNIYPVADYVYNVANGTNVAIDVTKNDIICSNDVLVSVYHPNDSFPPYYGSATVVNKMVNYAPGPSFNGKDKIMYKVTDANDPSRSAYGIVYLTQDSVCQFRLVNDFFELLDSIHSHESVMLPVFLNDVLCAPVNSYQINIKEGPAVGSVSFIEGGINYLLPAISGDEFSDQFTYEVCIDASCKTALVNISFKESLPAPCLLVAKPDTLDLSTNNMPLMYLGVLANDSICTDLTNFRITKAPKYGSAFISDDLKSIGYNRDLTVNEDDWLEYEICDEERCSRTTAYIKQKE